MKAETRIRLTRLRKFSRVARWLCSGFLAFVVAISAWALFSVLTGPSENFFKFDLGRIAFTGDQIDTISLKAWLTLLLVVGIYISTRMLWLLHGLFGNLARGEIYTQDNVRRLRSLGWLMLSAACAQVVAPVVSMMLLAARVIEWSQATHSGFSYFSPGNLAAFVIAAIVILVSWIMDVGLDVSEEAETLRRDAEFVV